MNYIIMALACWRLSNLLANETGPKYIFESLRSWCRECHPEIHRGLECEWCVSVWVGTGLTIGLAVMGWSIIWLCLPFALSTCTIFLKYILEWIRKVG